MNAGQSRARPAVEDFLKRLVRTTLIVGKGGVGKTTCAVGAAARLAAAGETTLLVSTDPAGSLGPALGISLVQGRIRQIEPMPGLSAMQLDPSSARQRFLERWRDVLVTILDRGTYLDAVDIGGLVDAVFPGADEIFGLLVLAELLANGRGEGERTSSRFARLVIDTAPTGHTLRLLALPETFDALVSLLESMQSKHRFMVQALTHRYRHDAADEFLEDMRGMLARLRSVLGDASQSRAVLITRAEQVVASESARYVEALQGLGIKLAAVVVEAVSTALSETERTALAALSALAAHEAVFTVPVVNPPPADLEQMRQSLGSMIRLPSPALETEARIAGVERTERERKKTKRWRERETAAVPWNSGSPPSAAASPLLRLLRVLTIVGGKGGVGKSTVACALALAAALDDQGEGEVLLVSTDPAPSLGDALGIDAPRWAHDGPVTIAEVPRLCAWQMDAGAAFQSLRDRYRDRIDAVFDAVTGRGLDIANDRAIMRDLLSLAPPGVDELYALASLGEALSHGRFERIIVDPAPTGHLLRLLELPSLAIDWSHRLMRLIMKYKDIVALGDTAEDLINFSRRTRTLQALLRDATRAGVVLVSLDEPVVIAESARLAISLQQRQVAVLGEVWNRLDVGHESRGNGSKHGGERERVAATVFEAPEVSRTLVGLEAIREWSDHWILRHSRPTT